MTMQESEVKPLKITIECTPKEIADLAKATGYSLSTIESLMCGSRASDNVYKAVAKVLNIPEHLARKNSAWRSTL